LLAYLILNGRRCHSREILATLLWSDTSQERARNALRTTLWRLRRSLEPCGMPHGTYLIAEARGEVGLNWESDLWNDVIAFREAISPIVTRPTETFDNAGFVRLQSAISMYSGELLEGYYEDWILREREHLRELYLEALVTLMRGLSDQQNWDGALAFGLKVLAEDPLRESIHREVMRLHLRLGQRALALRQYERYACILKDELGVEPMEETRALYARIVSGPVRDGPVRDGPALKPPRPDPNHADVEQALRNIEDALATMREASETLLRAVRATSMPPRA